MVCVQRISPAAFWAAGSTPRTPAGMVGRAGAASTPGMTTAGLSA